MAALQVLDFAPVSVQAKMGTNKDRIRKSSEPWFCFLDFDYMDVEPKIMVKPPKSSICS